MSQLSTGTKPSKYTLATRATLEAIAAERDELKVFLSEARGELHRMMIELPVKYQSKKFLGICQDIGYYEGEGE